MRKRPMTVTEFARLGGYARAAKMTAEARRLAGQKASRARWAKVKGKRVA